MHLLIRVTVSKSRTENRGFSKKQDHPFRTYFPTVSKRDSRPLRKPRRRNKQSSETRDETLFRLGRFQRIFKGTKNLIG